MRPPGTVRVCRGEHEVLVQLRRGHDPAVEHRVELPARMEAVARRRAEQDLESTDSVHETL